MINKEFRRQSRALKRAFWIFFALCTGLLLADLLYDKHAILEPEAWFGFYGFYGFIACVVLVLVAKELRKLVMRKEDYYNER